MLLILCMYRSIEMAWKRDYQYYNNIIGLPDQLRCSLDDSLCMLFWTVYIYTGNILCLPFQSVITLLQNSTRNYHRMEAKSSITVVFVVPVKIGN